MVSIKSSLEEFQASQEKNMYQRKLEQLEKEDLQKTVAALRIERDRLQRENFELTEKLDKMRQFFDHAFKSTPQFWFMINK